MHFMKPERERSTPPAALTHPPSTPPSTSQAISDDSASASDNEDHITPTRTANGSTPRRPQRPAPRPAIGHAASFQTRYVEMLLHLDKIPRIYNLAASFFTWILLAGFVVFPGTFNNLKGINTRDSDANAVEREILYTVKNAPLLWVAGACCVVGTAGMVGLWIRWRKNYVWIINRIFFPGLLNGLTGLISTFVNIYTAQSGDYSITAKVTIIVTGATAVISGLLFVIYSTFILARVKKAHERQVAMTGEQPHESVMEKMRKPALDPESVV